MMPYLQVYEPEAPDVIFQVDLHKEHADQTLAFDPLAQISDEPFPGLDIRFCSPHAGIAHKT